ncbi:MAG: triose-phosphate isomerase [Gammaproteobacteria bacterium]|nr:triose-phosphate isomerase [Gammaproteobacteria bacterium]
MRRPMVAGNWKMVGTRSEVEVLANSIAEGAGEVSAVELAVFPSFIFIDQIQRSLSGTIVAYGAQNISSERQGAFTGEVSATMVAEFGCQYVIIGHSERRQYYGESDQVVAMKFSRAIEARLKPIICVGESLAEREAGQTLSVIGRQLEAVLALDNAEQSLYNAVLAYEPVWAIGTGKTATPEEAQTVHQYLREQVAKRDEKLAKALRILYGGSVKRDNAAELMSQPDVDGGLVGGASLDSQHFLDIARLCNR